MRVWLAVAVTLAAAALRADNASPLPPPPVIDVVVTDARGRAVPTLTPGDFVIDEAGAARRIASARFVHGETRAVGIFLDEFHTAPGDAAARVRDTLARIVRTGLAAPDRIVVFKPLDSVLAISTTTDHEAAARTIETFEGRKGDYEPRTAFERDYIAGAPARVESARMQIAISALNALATHLGTLDNSRKTMIVVADGLGRRGRTRGGLALPSLETVRRAADNARVSIYTVEVNPAGGDTAGADAVEALRSLAADTGGRSITPADDLTARLGAALADADGYYALSIESDAAADGKFHPVDVRVTRKNLTVRARRGYFAALPKPAPSASALAALTPIAAGPPRRTSPLIRAWFGQARGQGDATRVSFVWEPAPVVPASRSAPPRPARVALSVTQPDGTRVFDGVVLPSGPADVGVGDSSASFEMPPGRLLVQMKIEDAGSRLLDTDVRDLTVGRFTGPVAFGTPELYRARNAREYRALADDPNAIPVAARQFSRAERLLVRAPVYAASAPTVSARLVSRFGEALRDLPAAAGVHNGYQLDVPLAGLAAGEYSIELTASAAGATVKESIGIRVTP